MDPSLNVITQQNLDKVCLFMKNIWGLDIDKRSLAKLLSAINKDAMIKVIKSLAQIESSHTKKPLLGLPAIPIR